MELQEIRKVHSGKFVDRYDAVYRTREGNEKIYEMISRNHNLKTLEDLNNPKLDAVVMAIFDESREHIVLDREFRLAAGTWVYNFPAGRIDPGGTPEEAARRELWEETGLELISLDDIIGECYSAIGFSNEKNLAVVGTARGEFRPSTSEYEEIESGWYSKAEVRELLKTQMFAGRTQAFCYCWCNQQ